MVFLIINSIKKQKILFHWYFDFSALFTPPDVISQIGIAIPLIIFYEFSILFIKFFIAKKMHDIRFIKENTSDFEKSMKKETSK